MKIVLATGIYPPEIGGPASFTRELARELKKLGQEPCVVCYGDRATAVNDGWDVVVVSRSGGAFVRYCRYAWRVFRAVKKSDLVFLQGPVSEGLPGTIGARLAGKPTMMKVVGDYAWEIYRQKSESNIELLDEFVKHVHGGSVRLLEAIERWTARRARVVVTPSRFLKSVVSAWGVDPEKISVIYNSIPPLPETETREALRERIGLGANRVILTVVRAVPWKHGDFLCEVMSKLPDEYRLVIVGDGPSLVAWKKRVQEIGVEGRVIFTGKQPREKVAEWYAMADVFVLPSGYEGFPHVVAEASSVGLPSIVSDKGGNPETRELFPNHVEVVSYLDIDAWVKALLKERPRNKPEFSRSFGQIADEYLEMMKKICAS
ncbi:MAG: glycosyltransferase family 4 protein [Patescibacteria group bacterium]|nr:glycosyltransferase family 4 protein [Patescibacteria group bacterium]